MSIAPPPVVERPTRPSSPPAQGDRVAAGGRRWVLFLVGAALLVSGVATMITAGLGVGSWQVLETGLVAATGAPLGAVVLVESVLVLLLAWVWLRQVPGPATLLLAAVGGPAIGGLVAVLPSPDGLWAAGTMLGAGLLLTGVGVGVYVAGGLGASAQDSLFLGLHHRFRWRPSIARFVTDVAVVMGGWLLGGQVGMGTILAALAIPPLVEIGMRSGTRWLVPAVG